MRFLLSIMVMLVLENIYAQQLNVRDLEKFRNENLPIIYDQKGNELGNNSYESKSLIIVFYKVSFDEKKKEFSIQGRVLDNNGVGDSAGLAGVDILQAQVKSNKMTVYSFLGVSNFPKSSQRNKPGSPTGDFDVRVKLRKNSKIYFVDQLHTVVEYNINKMLEQNVSSI